MNTIEMCREIEEREDAIIAAEHAEQKAWDRVQELIWKKQCETKRHSRQSRQRLAAINDDLRIAWREHRIAHAALKRLNA